MFGRPPIVWLGLPSASSGNLRFHGIHQQGPRVTASAAGLLVFPSRGCRVMGCIVGIVWVWRVPPPWLSHGLSRCSASSSPRVWPPCSTPTTSAAGRPPWPAPCRALRGPFPAGPARQLRNPAPDGPRQQPAGEALWAREANCSCRCHPASCSWLPGGTRPLSHG